MSTLASLGRCGVIGDVHCESEVLERVLDALESRGVEPALCVGDLVDGYGDADATLKLLESRRVQCVAGNHERWFLAREQRTLDHATQEISEESLAFIRSLPKMRHYQTLNGKTLLCHGVGEADEAWLLPDTKGYALQDIPTLRELMLEDDVQFMIGGHTHERMVRVFPGLTVINVGTIHRKNEQTFAVIDFDEMRVEYYSAAADSTGKLLEELELPIPPPVG
ncbi:MAG: metallophosphoesterase family protein [Deltaproteobacteria bacterium]|nr:metallophosphoesterase family protein [Deltaproteobacteria bacterium]